MTQPFIQIPKPQPVHITQHIRVGPDISYSMTGVTPGQGRLIELQKFLKDCPTPRVTSVHYFPLLVSANHE